MPVISRSVLPIRSHEDIVRVRQAARENAIAQSLLDVRNSRTAIDERQAHALAGRFFQARDLNLASAAIVQRVAGQFTGGRHQLGLIHE